MICDPRIHIIFKFPQHSIIHTMRNSVLDISTPFYSQLYSLRYLNTYTSAFTWPLWNRHLPCIELKASSPYEFSSLDLFREFPARQWKAIFAYLIKEASECNRYNDAMRMRRLDPIPRPWPLSTWVTLSKLFDLINIQYLWIYGYTILPVFFTGK